MILDARFFHGSVSWAPQYHIGDMLNFYKTFRDIHSFLFIIGVVNDTDVDLALV